MLVLIKWKKLINLEVMVLAMGVVGMLGCGFMSGHTLDQFVTSIFMAMLVAILLNRIKDAYKKEDSHE